MISRFDELSYDSLLPRSAADSVSTYPQSQPTTSQSQPITQDGTSSYQPEQYAIDQNAFNLSTAGKNQLALERDQLKRDRVFGTDRRSYEQQQQLSDFLRQQAFGKAPSAAELQMRQGLDQQIAAANALQASARGVSPGMAARQAQQQQAQASLQTNADLAQLRAGEQAGAQQAYGQHLAGMRQQALSQQAHADQMTQQYLAMGWDMDRAKQQALMDAQALGVQNQSAYNQVMANMYASDLGLQGTQYTADMNLKIAEEQAAAQKQAALMGAIGSGVGAAGSMAMMSDRRTKRNIKKLTNKDVDKFLSEIRPYGYKYRQGEGHTKKDQAGVMAQDMAKTKLGKTFTRKVMSNGNERLALDVRSGLGAALVGLGRLGQRLSLLEQKG